MRVRRRLDSRVERRKQGAAAAAGEKAGERGRERAQAEWPLRLKRATSFPMEYLTDGQANAIEGRRLLNLLTTTSSPGILYCDSTAVKRGKRGAL
jgi:hypothetical protein